MQLPGKGQAPTVEIMDLPDIECPVILEGTKCGNTAFITGKRIKKVSELIDVPGSPIGHEGYILIAVAVCIRCWEPLPEKM